MENVHLVLAMVALGANPCFDAQRHNSKHALKYRTEPFLNASQNHFEMVVLSHGGFKLHGSIWWILVPLSSSGWPHLCLWSQELQFHKFWKIMLLGPILEYTK